jgi:hypothetical protein
MIIGIGAGNPFEFIEYETLECSFLEANLLRRAFFEKSNNKDVAYLPDKIIEGFKNINLTALLDFAESSGADPSHIRVLLNRLLYLSMKALTLHKQIGFIND